METESEATTANSGTKNTCTIMFEEMEVMCCILSGACLLAGFL